MIVQYDEEFDIKRDALATEMVKAGMNPEQAQDYARHQLLLQMSEEEKANAKAERAKKRSLATHFRALLSLVTSHHQRR